MAIASDENFERTIGGLVLKELHSDATPHVYQAESEWSLDPSSKRMLLAVHDNFGGFRVFVAQKWQESNIAFTEVTIVGALKRKERFVYTRKSTEIFGLEYDVQTDAGVWKMGDATDCSRRP